MKHGHCQSEPTLILGPGGPSGQLVAEVEGVLCG